MSESTEARIRGSRERLDGKSPLRNCSQSSDYRPRTVRCDPAEIRIGPANTKPIMAPAENPKKPILAGLMAALYRQWCNMKSGKRITSAGRDASTDRLSLCAQGRASSGQLLTARLFYRGNAVCVDISRDVRILALSR